MEKNESVESAASQSKDKPNLIMFPPALWLGTILLSALLHHFWPLHLVSALWARIVGGIFVVAGIALARWGRMVLVRAGTNVVPTKPTLSIVTDGPYRFTRNPLYVGGSIVYLGVTLFFNTAWLVILGVPMFLLLEFGIVRREESYLETKFGKVYLDYKARVPRWI